MKRARDFDFEQEQLKSVEYYKNAIQWLCCNRYSHGSLPSLMPLGPARIIGRMIHSEGDAYQQYLDELVRVRIIVSFTLNNRRKPKKQIKFIKRHIIDHHKVFDIPHLLIADHGESSLLSIDTYIDYFVHPQSSKKELEAIIDNINEIVSVVPATDNIGTDWHVLPTNYQPKKSDSDILIEPNNQDLGEIDSDTFEQVLQNLNGSKNVVIVHWINLDPL